MDSCGTRYNINKKEKTESFMYFDLGVEKDAHLWYNSDCRVALF